VYQTSKFRPAWWLRNPHLQPIWCAKATRSTPPRHRTERLTTPDGDFIDVAWTDGDQAPVVAIFHGLTGSLRSPYSAASLNVTAELGFNGAFMHFRSCSGEPNRKAMSYHSGQTCDIDFFIDLIRKRHPTAPVAAIGFSLGANALLKYLANKPQTPIQYAIAVCPPLVLQEGAKQLNTGLSRIYQRVLLSQLKTSIERKIRRYPELRDQFPNYRDLQNFRDFDDAITAPLHGFSGVDDYYQRASTLNDLINIHTDTHIIFSRDDPFFSPRCLPTEDQLPANVCFELSEHGGHVGFAGGEAGVASKQWLPGPWLPTRLKALLQQHLCTSGQKPAQLS